MASVRSGIRDFHSPRRLAHADCNSSSVRTRLAGHGASEAAPRISYHCGLRRHALMASKEPGFAERLQTAAKAKKDQLGKIRATKLASGAQSAERRAVRVETAEARKIRTTERKDSNRIS